MCKFLFLIPKRGRGVSLEEVVKRSKKLINLDGECLNLDGFGIGYSFEGRHQVYRSIGLLEHDQNIHLLSPLIYRSPWVLLHLRKASNDVISHTNCHPFSYGNITMAHIGEFALFNLDRKSVIDRIDDQLLLKIKGNTDSEYFFYALLTDYFRTGDMKISVERTVDFFSRYDCCLNIVLIDNDDTYLVTYNNYLSDMSKVYYSQEWDDCDAFTVLASEMTGVASQGYHVLDAGKMLKIYKLGDNAN